MKYGSTGQACAVIPAPRRALLAEDTHFRGSIYPLRPGLIGTLVKYCWQPLHCNVNVTAYKIILILLSNH